MKYYIDQDEEGINLSGIIKINTLDENGIVATLENNDKISIAGSLISLKEFNPNEKSLKLTGVISSYYIIDKFQKQKPKRIKLSSRLKNSLKKAKQEMED